MKYWNKAIFWAFWGTLAWMSTGCGPSAEEQKAKSDKAEARKVPQIAWRDVSFIDTIEQGDTVVRHYVFYNTGWKPVRVKHAIPNRPECTCEVPQRDIPIGETDSVKLTCIFKDFEPQASVEIIVEHNTPQPEPTLVYMGRMFRK